MSDWGQGAKNNDIGWGQGAVNNDIGWGLSHSESWAGDTDIVGGVSFDATYQAILDYATAQGYTLPSDSQKLLQNQLLIDLKTAGVWNKLDTFANFATDGSSNFALIDWKRLTQYTAVNSPTFTTNQGFKGNGTSSYIDMNFNASAFGGNYKQNDACFGCFVDNIGGSVLMNTSLSRSLMRSSANSFNGINSSNAVSTTLAFATGAKMAVHDRALSTSYKRISDASVTETINQASTGLPNTMWALRDQYAYNGASTYRFVFAGASIDLVKSDLFNLLDSYFSSL